MLARDEAGKVCRDENGDFCLECTCGLVLSGKSNPSDPLFTPYGSAWTNNSLPILELPPDQDPRLNPRNNCIHNQYKSVALIPIRTDKEIVGLLQLNSRHKDRLSLSMVNFYENICDSIGTALVRKQTQLELRLANKSLRKATSRASLLKSKAEAANKAKGQFLANMSHELRTPLNSILGFSELLSNENLDTDAKNFVDIIKRQGNMLLGLVNDILDFTVIEAGKLRIEMGDVGLDDFAKQIETTFTSLAESKGLDFKVVCDKNLPKTIKTDCERLNQCINNLLNNAIKFTHSGKVSVKINNLEDKNLIRFDIEDTGIGIPENKQKDVFEAFMQADLSHSRKYGGTGLGLPIVKHIVGLLGGELSLISKEGRGTTFTILIPPHPEGVEQPEQEQKQTDITDIKLSGKVLVVEDSPVNLKLLVLMLEKIGFNIETACDGIEALEKIDTNDFDLIYMDIQMPRMNGYEATREIKRRGITAPVIAVTAAAMDEDRIKCEQAGCDYYITKPVNKQKLFEVAAKFLHN